MFNKFHPTHPSTPMTVNILQMKKHFWELHLIVSSQVTMGAAFWQLRQCHSLFDGQPHWHSFKLAGPAQVQHTN